MGNLILILLTNNKIGQKQQRHEKIQEKEKNVICPFSYRHKKKNDEKFSFTKILKIRPKTPKIWRKK